jgi:hypothetical protein
MRHLEHHTKAQSAELGPLPTAPFFRRLVCRTCRDTVVVCTLCDRGQIDCPQCRPERQKERKRVVRRRYRRTKRGRVNHAAAEKRRRARKKDRKLQSRLEVIPQTVGDRGSPPRAEQRNDLGGQCCPTRTEGPHDPALNLLPEPLAPVCVTVGPKPRPRCTFCHRPCEPFSRQTTGHRWRKEKKRLRSLGPWRGAP